MKLCTPEISWHEREPIYSCTFHPVRKNVVATASVTGVVRLWEIRQGEEKVEVDFLANLKRHTKAVNCIRWNHDGSILASGGDDGAILLWTENEVKNQKTLDMDEEEAGKENWFVFKTLRGHLEDVLDMCWSKDGTLLLSGAIDSSAILWNVSTGNKVAILKEPKGYVQGVTIDPLGNYYAIISTDRSLRFYSTNSNKCIFNVNKMTIPKENTESTQVTRLFYDDTMKTFFRRLAFSFDGNLIFAPAGCLELEDKILNVTYLFTRGCLNKPCLYIPHDKPSIAIAVCPFRFELLKHENNENCEKPAVENVFTLPYRLVFAIATEDSIHIYDTQHLVPFGYVTGIHYSHLTDICWSNDARYLIVTSVDGFCTFVQFKPNELGEIVDSAEFEMETATLSQQKQQQQPGSAPSTPKHGTKAESAKPENSIKTLFANQAAKVRVAEQVKSSKIVDIDEITVISDTTSTTTTTTTDSKGPRRIKLVPLNS